MSEHKSNIYDAYMFKYKKFIIALSYTPGLDIQPIIDDMAKTFNFITLKLEGSKMLKSDSIFNYDKLNSEVSKILSENEKNANLNIPGSLPKGILLYGLNFPASKITNPIDLQLHYSASAAMFLKANVDENNFPMYTIDDYNGFKNMLAENKINKYFNIKSVVGMEINDATFEKIIDFFEFKVYGKDYNILSSKSKKENANKELVNPNPTDILEISKKNEIIREDIDTDTTDAALSISADIADYSGKYNTKKKETAKYLYKKMEAKITDKQMEIPWDADLDNNIDTELDTDLDIEGGYISTLNHVSQKNQSNINWRLIQNQMGGHQTQSSIKLKKNANLKKITYSNNLNNLSDLDFELLILQL
jgi:hypothetical protein